MPAPNHDECHKATSESLTHREVNRIAVLGSRIVAAPNSPIQPTVTAPPEHWLPVLRYFLGLTLNFWPPTDASYISPPLACVKIATPSL
jgi:hypothetical protein